MKARQISVLPLAFLILLGIFSNLPGRVEASYDLSKVAYYDRVKQALNLTSDQENMLREHGFTVAKVSPQYPSQPVIGTVFYPLMRFEDFYYTKVFNPDLPVFVTTDSILHLFHVIFDCSLKMIENETFYSMINEVSQYAFSKSLSDYNSIAHDGSLKYWAIRNATVYFGVATSLITGIAETVPNELTKDLDFFLNNIYTHTQFVPAGTWLYPNQEVDIQYDFTQFTVRGHYLGTPILERYFRTLMWYGNMPVFIPRSDETYRWSVSHIDGPASVYIHDFFKQSPSYFNKWITVYNVTSALVGESDSINPLNLDTALHNAFGNKDQYLDLVAASGGLAVLTNELSKPQYQQQILGQGLVKDSGATVRYPIVFQFMGQRYVPDSYMFQMLCYDKTGMNSLGQSRIIPKGLDVFAVLGSDRANQLLEPDYQYKNYADNLAALTSQFSKLTDGEWTQSSYTAWLHSLQSLVNTDYNASYPDFMRDIAWKDEKLNTALGSWAQLRHDTILYAKQTYIPTPVCSYPEAFVEPNPTFYSRMQQLTQRTLAAINILPSQSKPSIAIDCLGLLMAATQKLEAISAKELTKQTLTAAETDFVKQIVYTVPSGYGASSGIARVTGWYYDTITNMANGANSTGMLNAPVIADVATVPPGGIFPAQILHVGVGYVNALVVLYPQTNGSLVAAVGPVFSYYEFPLMGTKRLTDTEWRTMLTFDNSTAYLPSWVKDIYAMATPTVAEFENTTGLMLMAAMAITMVALTKIARAKRKHYPKSQQNNSQAR